MNTYIMGASIQLNYYYFLPITFILYHISYKGLSSTLWLNRKIGCLTWPYLK